MAEDTTRREFIERCAAAALLAGLPPVRAAEAIAEELLAATRVEGPEQPIIGWLNGIPITGLPAYEIDGLDQQITAIMKETGIPGFSFAVSRYVDRRSRNAPWNANELKFVRGYGKSNIEHDVTMTACIPINALSISKVITTVFAGAAHAQGKIDFFCPNFFERYGRGPLAVDPAHHFPGQYRDAVRAPFDERWHQISLSQICSHTSGVPEMEPEAFPLSDEERAHYGRPENMVLGRQNLPEMIRSLMRLRLREDPGTTFRYQGRALDLAALAIAEQYGQNVEEAINRVVFQPLGIAGAANGWSEQRNRLLWQFGGNRYVGGPQGHVRPGGYPEPGYLYRSCGSGSWYVPTIGLCRFVSHFRYLLSDDVFRRMFERPEWLVKLGREAAGDKWNGYHGLGWAVGRNPANDQIRNAGHNGMGGGERAEIGWALDGNVQFGNGGNYVYAFAGNSSHDAVLGSLREAVLRHVDGYRRATWPAHDLWPEYGFAEPELAFPG